MKLTQEVIDIIAPTHGRMSCNDDTQINGSGGWTGKYDRNTGHKEIRHPRCTRCYLLRNIGEDIDTLEFRIEPNLVWKGDE
jgi:hypothetical protein